MFLFKQWLPGWVPAVFEVFFKSFGSFISFGLNVEHHWTSRQRVSESTTEDTRKTAQVSIPRLQFELKR